MEESENEVDANETIFEANSGGVRHYHCMDSVMAQKIVLDMFKKQIANG